LLLFLWCRTSYFYFSCSSRAVVYLFDFVSDFPSNCDKHKQEGARRDFFNVTCGHEPQVKVKVYSTVYYLPSQPQFNHICFASRPRPKLVLEYGTLLQYHHAQI